MSSLPDSASAWATPARPRVRFAPSPTGDLHVGGARTALFNWLHARSTGGQFLLRIEDTDAERSTEASTRAIFDGLAWLGLTWDEEVVYQAAHADRHAADARRLLAAGAAYRCFCPAEHLQAERAAAKASGRAFRYDRRCADLAPDDVERRVAAGVLSVIRFRVPLGETAWNDRVHGRIAFPNADIEDFIILRSDGTPVYNMAVVSDDAAMRVTLVLRGDDHISNTPKQILLYQALGAPVPEFGHLPMIHGEDGKKLSKRKGATAVADYQAQGIVPSAMMNFLALLGWSPGNDREVMTQSDLVDAFSLDRLLKKASVFDTRKLLWMNGKHLSLLPAAGLRAAVVSAASRLSVADPDALEALGSRLDDLIALVKDRARTVDEVVQQIAPFVSDRVAFDPAAVAKAWADRSRAAYLLRVAADALSRATNKDDWEETRLEAALRSAAEQEGVSASVFFQVLRVALTGRTVSPSLTAVLSVLGRDAAVRRLHEARTAVLTLATHPPATDHVPGGAPPANDDAAQTGKPRMRSN